MSSVPAKSKYGCSKKDRKKQKMDVAKIDKTPVVTKNRNGCSKMVYRLQQKSPSSKNLGGGGSKSMGQFQKKQNMVVAEK